jgi:hypothetical protein
VEPDQPKVRWTFGPAKEPATQHEWEMATPAGEPLFNKINTLSWQTSLKTPTDFKNVFWCLANRDFGNSNKWPSP